MTDQELIGKFEEEIKDTLDNNSNAKAYLAIIKNRFNDYSRNIKFINTITSIITQH